MGYAENSAENFSSRFSLSLTALEQGSTSLGPPKRRIAHRASLAGFLIFRNKLSESFAEVGRI
jgi:hypothetical protein